ncbi:MAG: hypothetical protein RBU30_06885 [Polyangia bacterium]|nr:hypothetical protein [Polyangia bacterium]
MPKPLGGGAIARIIVQPVAEKAGRTAFTWVLHVTQADKVRALHRVLGSAPKAVLGTCPPAWRLDLRYGHDEKVAFVSVPCRRLVVDGKEHVYDDAAQRVIEPLLREAGRKPGHKLFPVKVPAEHDPEKVLPLLAARAMEAFLPERPARRGPVASMSFAMQQYAPADPRLLDQAVAELRRTAFEKLTGYAQQLRIGRKEILDVIGPEPMFERFGDRLFEARYRLTVLFRHGTPEYMLGFLGLGSDLTVDKISVPKDYRAELLFQGETTVAEMRKAVSSVNIEPRLSRY